MKLALPLIAAPVLAALALTGAAPALAQSVKPVPQINNNTSLTPTTPGGALRADISLGCRLDKSSRAVVRNTTRYILPEGSRIALRFNGDRRIVRLEAALYPGKTARFEAAAAPECRAIAQF